MTTRPLPSLSCCLVVFTCASAASAADAPISESAGAGAGAAAETSAAAEAPPATETTAGAGAAEPAPSGDGKGAAEAAAAATEDDDAPKIHLGVAPAPANPARRTYHRHDGFYLRTNFGVGFLWATLDDGGEQNFDVDASGTGMALDLLIGGSPSPGIALGGGVITNWSFSADFEREGAAVPDRDVQDLTLGVFVDGFPDDTGPWHLGALVGFSTVRVNQDAYVNDTAGLGGAIWAGYDQWVADDWALGGQLRLTINRTGSEADGFDVTASTATLGLLFSALYH